MNETFVSMSQPFEEMLGDIKYDPIEKGLYPFMVRCGVAKYRPPRHPFFEYLINLGMGDIENVLYHTGGELSGVLTFVFPERHMSVHEQRSFTSQLNKHPTVDKITQVDIITSCPMLVGSFYAEMIRVLTWEDDKELIPFC
ncbi:MAG: hypothetical protein ACTSX1_11360 [Candidatus Heimdallarchaeaceae archaeon]